MASRSFNNAPSGTPGRSSRSSRRYSPTRDAGAAASFRERAGAVLPSSWTRTIRSYVPASLTTNLARLDPRSRQQQTTGTIVIPIVDPDDRRPRWLRQLPSLSDLPALPALSSLARTIAPAAPADANAAAAGAASRRSYTTVLEPFHPVDDPGSDDDGSTGTSVPSPGADASPAAPWPPSSASTDADPDAYFLVHDAGDVDADETYDPRRWAALQHQQQPAERLWDGARRVGEVALEAARVGVQVGGVLMSAGTADLVGDLAREIRVRGARRRVGMDIVREQFLQQTGEGGMEDEQQLEDEEEDEKDEEDEKEDAEEDEVEDKKVEDDEDEDVEILTEGLTGPWAEQTGTGGGSPNEDEAFRSAKEDEDDDSSVDGDDAFFDAPEESAPSTRSGPPTPSNRGAPSSPLPAATPQLTSAVHDNLVDVELAAGFDILNEEDIRRPMWDLDDIAPYHRRPLHAYRRRQHTQRRRQHENAVASTGTSNATSATRQPRWMSAYVSRPATLPNSTPTTGRTSLGTRVLTRAPSPGSAGIAMISERPQNLPRSNVSRHNTRGNGRGDGGFSSSINGSRR